MSLAEHFLELRKRLLISAIAIMVGLVAGWFLKMYVWDVLRRPIKDIEESTGRLAAINYGDVTSAFDLQVQIALFIAVIIASPVWLYQIWAFFAPGLTKREKLYTVGFFGSAIPLFLAGIYAGWLVFPNIVRLLISFAPAEDPALLTARSYLDLAFKLMLAVGIGFVMPVFIVLLNFIGVFSAKSIIKSWRVAILAIILFAGITTPAADLVSMFLLAVPMILLYFIAALIAYIHDRRHEKRMTEEFAEYDL
ncbi:twin-arginine translocase subunit TatC [Leucobacter chinensis]|uniref:twin-arginine translocase subunit TatC n=1 Tax=Leucobacter chinensis TaxID=2851010 RepID=UPI001C212191|nr:twin-arginine translocase subunit TatC [Leucobacter chinensis]